jgi:hypothetical protein
MINSLSSLSLRNFNPSFIAANSLFIPITHKVTCVIDRHFTSRFPNFCNRNLFLKKMTFAAFSGATTILLNVIFLKTFGIAPLKKSYLATLGLIAFAVKYLFNQPRTPESRLPFESNTGNNIWSRIAEGGNFKDKAALSLVCKQMNRIVSKEPDHQIINSIKLIMVKKIKDPETLTKYISCVRYPKNPIESEAIEKRILSAYESTIAIDQWGRKVSKNALEYRQRVIFDQENIRRLTTVFWFFINHYEKINPTTQNLVDKFILNNLAISYFERRNLKTISMQAPFPQAFLKKEKYQHLGCALYIINETRTFVGSEGNKANGLLRKTAYFLSATPYTPYFAKMKTFYDESKILDEELIMDCYRYSSTIMENVHPDVLQSKEFFLKMLTSFQNGYLAFRYADPLLKQDKDYIIALLKLNPKVYECLDDSLKNHREILLGSDVPFAQIPSSLRGDKELILRKFTHHKLYTQIHHTLLNDPDILRRYHQLAKGFQVNSPYS